MGSTPSAVPAHYRSSYSAVDAYQGNGMDAATGMTHSGGGSLEQQSVGGGGPGGPAVKPVQPGAGGGAPSASPVKDLFRAKSAKGSKADKIAAAIAAGAAASAADAAGVSIGTSQTGRMPASNKNDAKAKGHKPASSMEFSIQGSGPGSLAAASAASAAAASGAPAVPASSSKPKRAPAASPARSETPEEEGGVGSSSGGTDHASYFETRILKPMPEYADAQFRELAHIITRSDNRWRTLTLSVE